MNPQQIRLDHTWIIFFFILYKIMLYITSLINMFFF